jgi:hypothetical protein
MTETYCGCGKSISPKTKSGRCVRCAAADPAVRAKKGLITDEQRASRALAAQKLNSDPAVIAKRRIALIARNCDPEHRARLSEACRASMARRMEDPAYAARLREAGKALAKLNPLTDPEVRKQAGMVKRRRMLAWCPEEYWDLNAKMKRAGLLLPERKQAILEQVPGTPEHARRIVASNALNMQLKHEREVGSRY